MQEIQVTLHNCFLPIIYSVYLLVFLSLLAQVISLNPLTPKAKQHFLQIQDYKLIVHV